MSVPNRIKEITIEPETIYTGDKIKVKIRYFGPVLADDYTRYFLGNFTDVISVKEVEYVNSNGNVDNYIITNQNDTTVNVSIPNGQMELIDIEVNNNLEVVIRSSPNIKCFLDDEYNLTIEFLN